MTKLSVLDLCPVNEGDDVATALGNSAKLAAHTEQLGYNRFWLAEHHNMPGIASAATSVVIGHVAAATKKIRVGSCCRTIHHWLSPSSTARWPLSFRVVST